MSIKWIYCCIIIQFNVIFIWEIKINFLILLLFLFVIIYLTWFMNSSRVGADIFPTTYECITVRHGNRYPPSHEIDKIIFEYENDRQALVLYNSPDGTFWNCHMLKIQRFGNTYYLTRRFDTIESHMYLTPGLNDEWKNMGNFRYRAVKDEDDIPNYYGKEPEVIEISYYLYNLEEPRTGYLCFVDLNELTAKEKFSVFIEKIKDKND